jgi:predicted MPP superfamily phosphohydrolase
MEIASERIVCPKGLSLFFLSDIHMGSGHHAKKSFQKAVQLIRKTELSGRTVRVLGGGDYIDAIVHTDRKRFDPKDFPDDMTVSDLADLPRIQFGKLLTALKPIAHLVRWAVPGNHEGSVSKYSQNAVFKSFCEDLPDCTALGYSAFIRLSLVRAEDSKQAVARHVFTTHGSGGGGFREGYAINNMMDIFRKYEADLYLMGHTHKMAEFRMEYVYPTKNNNIGTRVRWYGNGGCFLNTLVKGKPGYFEGRKGTMSDIGMLEWKFDWNSHTPSNSEEILVKHWM